MNSYQNKAQELLDQVDVQINGSRPWDIQVKDKRFFKRIFAEGSLGLGESYLDEWWEAESLDGFFCKILSTNLESKVHPYKLLWFFVQSKLFNLQSLRRAFQVGEKHYDIGNDLFELMLDKRLTYTCGYWKNASNLDQAQEHKLDLVCKKIKLKENQMVLDIGCGWGSFMKFAVEKYGCKAVGVTVSEEQAKLARELCSGLDIEVKLQDYRNLTGTYDHIVSLGMFEHVGPKNYQNYMEVASRCLKNGGYFLLHTIGANKTRHTPDPWINKYIFPNGILPSLKDISTAYETCFILEDLHNFGADYDKTLVAWFENFDMNWRHLYKKYGDRFYRIWKYYLLACAGAFRARNIQLWQLVLSKNGTPGGYERVT